MTRFAACFRSLHRPLALALCVFGLALEPATAQQEGITVVLQEGQTLRDLAAEHLGDANLWPEILRASNLESVMDAKPGTRLRIPTASVALADRALEQAKARIQAATKAGARLFAPDLINEALALHEQALTRRKSRAWSDAYTLATQAQATADRALARSLDERNVSAEAIINDMIGTVQGRKPSDLTWSGRAMRSTLIEEERIRTLTGSFAEIMFRDESRLRINANSQAVIEQMRVDLLDKRQVANVSLVEGDLHALLGGNRARKSFELDVPGVDTEFESTNFWIGREEGTSRFANFDDRAIRVSSGGEEVVLQRNEGTLVAFMQAPTAPRKLLPFTPLVGPEDDITVFRSQITLEWEPVAGAVGYWLEIGKDRRFVDTDVNLWGHRETSYTIEEIEDGTYYWQVAAIDNQNFPGAKSEVRRFTIKNTERPPYLALFGPADKLILREPTVEVSGETEQGARLTLNGDSLSIDADGTFRRTIELTRGVNALTIEATDENGVVTRRTRSVTYMPDEVAEIRFNMNLPEVGPGQFVTSGDGFTLAGQTGAEAAIDLTSLYTHARTYTDSTGSFRLGVRMREAQEDYTLRVTTPSGFITEDSFSVLSDRSLPGITIEAPPPPVTAEPTFTFRGQVVDGTELLLNGRPVALADGRFEETVTWAPGLNQATLQTADVAGNTQTLGFVVQLDRDPPALDRFTLTPERAEGGETVEIEVFASDVSGIRQAAPFALSVGSWTHTGLLNLHDSFRSFRAVVNLPPDVRGPVRLQYVTISDYYGNSRRYESP